MPNYCYNSFKITGSKESLEAFRKKYVVRMNTGMTILISTRSFQCLRHLA